MNTAQWIECAVGFLILFIALAWAALSKFYDAAWLNGYRIGSSDWSGPPYTDWSSYDEAVAPGPGTSATEFSTHISIPREAWERACDDAMSRITATEAIEELKKEAV